MAFYNHHTYIGPNLGLAEYRSTSKRREMS